jgi:predicted anti-sigma-YlaC factor YlaD
MCSAPTHRDSPLLALAVAGAMVCALSSCSIQKLAVNKLGDALANSGSSWSSDDDPELVRDATPFALKTMESLLASSPRHTGLLLATASGFTQYSYAFVASEADYVESKDLAAATAMRARAVRLYRRAVGYGLRGLEVGHPGVTTALRRDPAAALATMSARDVPLLYWTGAAWAAAISLAKQDAELAADLPLVEAMMRRALALEEGFAGGAIHDFFIAFDGGRPAAAGGSIESARQHFARAMELARGNRAAPLVGLAETVSVATQNRAEFVELLRKAIAVDPDRAPEQRLANLIAQKRARWLLGRADDLFVE